MVRRSAMLISFLLVTFGLALAASADSRGIRRQAWGKGPKGEAVVTSNVVSTLWRIDPQTLAVTEHPLALDADAGRDVGFSSLIYSPRHAAYFAVSGAHGSVWRIDTRLQRAQKVGSTISKEDLPCATS